MKKLTFLVILVGFIACKSSSGNHKIHPDTCFTQIIFEYPSTYPPTTNTATAIRIVRDSLYVQDDDKAIHKADTIYYISYTQVVPDPKDSTHKTALKSRLNPKQDSAITTYYPVLSQYILQDFNHVHPLRQATK